MATRRTIPRLAQAVTPVATARFASTACRRSQWHTSSRIRLHPLLPQIQRRSISGDQQEQAAPKSEPRERYDYAQVQKIASDANSQTILIDVREPHEFAAGHIPRAINIPVQSQPDAFFLEGETFEDRFGMVKPVSDAEVVFYCKAGVRSKAAAEFAVQNGYKNVKEYPGSWIDWVNNGGEQVKP